MHSISENLTFDVPDPALLRSIVESHRPNLDQYADFYRDVHRNPEISAMEAETAKKVAAHLERLGYTVYADIGGYGVVGMFSNGPGKTVLMQAELEALPILEQTSMAYRSVHRMPWWTTASTYDCVPVPDLMLGQHVVPSCAGTVSIRSGPVLVAADSMRIRVIGGPCEGSINPQVCVDPIQLSVSIISRFQEAVTKDIGPDEDATLVKLDKRFVDQCQAAGVPRDPEFNLSVRAPLTNNDGAIAAPVCQLFRDYFADRTSHMAFTRA
ncbi:hypothetical protein CONLIGDRAFT_651646 [Coniochaeta ligniaria NRRL 30616]|uniref:Amidohydrolase n=1 Tax=Coniochaeta ligniaria NRRL 30616 TaxID=1408157 RepID=A0A1J7JZV2_9PEZI|nr:hypothetical protein CONLIGDRAFT_651646 [Coniochaeta ligniaria NRRL 30616]